MLPGIDRRIFDEVVRNSFEVNRTEDTSEYPEITLPFRFVDTGIRRHFIHFDFQKVFFVHMDQFGYLPLESVESSLMGSTCLFSVYLNLRIGHGTFENDKYTFAFPCRRYFECCFIQSGFVGFRLVMSVIEGPVSFHFPAGGNFDLIPFPAFPATGTEEVPFDRIVRPFP